MDFLLIQFLTGLSGAASLFLVAAGLTVIFGVTRVVNFAHGSLFMLGAYLGWSLLTRLPRDPVWFAVGVLLTAVAVGLIGLVLEMTLLRRLYRRPELFQLLATFGVVLIVQDLVPLIWGPADLSLPRPPWLRAFVSIAGQRFPRYDLVLIAIGPLVLAGLWLLLQRTRFGVLIRAATEDRDMAAALGINQRALFSAVFALGAALAGLAGALVLPDGSANLQMDLSVIVEAFVIVVVGGLGSVTGAFLASLLIGELQAFGIVLLPQATLVLIFAVMAVVLIVRPHGLLGRTLPPMRSATAPALVRQPTRIGLAVTLLALALAAAAPWFLGRYGVSVLQEALIAMLFAASLHLIMGPGGMPSFGHAAWFAIGAYAVGLASRAFGVTWIGGLPLAAIVAALASAGFGLFVARLSGVYLAMLTLAFAQIVWAIATQWSWLTGGDDGILGLWPAGGFHWAILAVTIAGTWLLRRALYAPFGYALRGVRDAPLRAETLGLGAVPLRVAAFALSGAMAGMAGGLFAYAKGSVFPSYVGIGRSVDALLMVLLGGVQTVSGPVIGALAYTGLYDALLLAVPLWRLALGAAIILLVLAFPDGLVGTMARWRWALRLSARRSTDHAAAAALAGTVQAADLPALRGIDAVSDAGVVAGSDADAPGARGSAGARSARDRRASLAGAGGPSPAPLLRVAQLGKSFDGIHAVADLSFDLAAGEVLALIGPNGAGKSTCFGLLNGQLRPDSGRVWLDGEDITGRRPRHMARLGIGRTFQVAAVFGSMTVRENVQLALLAHRRAEWRLLRRAAAAHRDAAERLLAQVALADVAEVACASLAYGDAKRLDLALALAHAPRLLLMDEPTAGMSSGESHRLMALVRRLVQERGCAVLFTEHDMDVVFGTADRILVMDRGSLIASGTAETVRADPAVRRAYLGE